MLKPSRIILFAMLALACSTFLLVAALSTAVSRISKEKQPDFARYVDTRTMSGDDLGLDAPGARVLIIGDVHGMRAPLYRLLAKAQYDPTHDVLIHLGDIVAKGPDSPATLAWFAARNISGVRGNHDEKVIEWRGWIDWVESHKGGKKWLRKLERKHPGGLTASSKKTKKGKKSWKIPDGWEFNGDHYRIARTMTPAEHAYLLALPLTLHLAPLHTLLGHAGLLPMDPTRSPTARKQPLAHAPKTGVRAEQERAIVCDVPQNDPWARLNMRSVLDDGTVSRDASEGAPWSDLWNAIMERCAGFEEEEEDVGAEPDQVILGEESVKPAKLPCHPATVVYGHAASRGLDIKPWSKGLDTGCVYGRRLTMLVLGDFHIDDADAQHIEFGQGKRAKLVHEDCSGDI